MYLAAALAAANPVLLKGEVAYESDTRKHKIGDGMTPWNSLPYETGGVPTNEGPVPGYRNLLPVPRGAYHHTDLLGRKEILLTFETPVEPSAVADNYMFIDAEIFANGAYALASLPLTIANIRDVDDPIQLMDTCLLGVASDPNGYAYVNIKLSDFSMQNGKYTGCRMTVISGGMADPGAYELHWRGLYLRVSK